MYTILMFGTAQAVLIRGVSLFQGCPYFRGLLISGVSLFQGVLISGVPLSQGVLIEGSTALFFPSHLGVLSRYPMPTHTITVGVQKIQLFQNHSPFTV